MVETKKVWIRRFGNFKHTGELVVSVLKDYWKQGIGTAMVTELIHWAKASKVIRKINLRVRSEIKGQLVYMRNLNLLAKE